MNSDPSKEMIYKANSILLDVNESKFGKIDLRIDEDKNVYQTKKGSYDF